MTIRRLALPLVLCLLAACSGEQRAALPNFVLILADDLGYGDIGPFGSRRNRTPELDRMAAEGMRLTSFYAGAPFCSASRASLLTGSHHRRVSIDVVLFPGDAVGLHPEEVTIAELLKQRGYATALIGKWHLGDQEPFLPNRQGFDYSFGLPYSNGMGPDNPGHNHPPLPLLRNGKVIGEVNDQTVLVEEYTREALRFIRENRDRPFFLYLPHTAVHRPLHPGKRFQGRSKNGAFGDWVEEVDWSTGEILRTLRDLGLDERTLVVFSSDNGPGWGTEPSPGPLRGRKGSVFEGGVRVPTLVRWPGRIPAGSASDEVAAAMDLFPTFAALAGAELPRDRKLDGADIWPILAGSPEAQSPHERLEYWDGPRLVGVRTRRWKLLDDRKGGWQLYDLENDMGERRDVAAEHPEVVERMQQHLADARSDLGRPENRRPAGRVPDPRPLIDHDHSIRPDARPSPAGPAPSAPSL